MPRVGADPAAQLQTMINGAAPPNLELAWRLSLELSARILDYERAVELHEQMCDQLISLCLVLKLGLDEKAFRGSSAHALTELVRAGRHWASEKAACSAAVLRINADAILRRHGAPNPLWLDGLRQQGRDGRHAASVHVSRRLISSWARAGRPPLASIS
jgi:hypothetical protein